MQTLHLNFVDQIIFLSYVVKSEFHMESQVTGDPGKMVAVQRNLSKFGIKELARTGKVRCACFWVYVCLFMLRVLFSLNDKNEFNFEL